MESSAARDNSVQTTPFSTVGGEASVCSCAETMTLLTAALLSLTRELFVSSTESHTRVKREAGAHPKR